MSECPAASAELRVADFDYALPPDLIAQQPLAERDASRLLVLDRESGEIRHSAMRDLAAWLAPGDLLVANNSRVIAARLSAVKAQTGGRVEVLLLQEVDADAGVWSALVRPARRLRAGMRLLVRPRLGAALLPVELDVVELGVEGEALVRVDPSLAGGIAAYGESPLPPYIGTPLSDPERYQTVYGSVAGSAAAPTAGLHFTERLLAELRTRGIGWAEVTLHVGLDTFRPPTAELAREHRIHGEWCEVGDETARTVAATREAGNRVVAVGTTAARTLETLGTRWDPTAPAGFRGMTELFILPGHRWRVVDALLTNFHLPRSTLLMLVSALAGWESVRRAYQEAVASGYRFYSFGDAMLVR